MMDPEFQVETASLNRNMMVEASAGTGKTHALEQLLGRLLTEEIFFDPDKKILRALKLEEILLVTFTEKAQKELKARVRKNIFSSLEKFGFFLKSFRL